jgi:indoleamine 2,3-dioxygenase
MNESCDPTVFYHRIRPFLAGSKNMAEAGLPHGVIYEDGSGTETYRQYSGGSNAQSSIIQFFDIVLGVDHHPTGEKRSRADSISDREGRAAAPKHNFIMEMRRYMPGPHARFLGDVQRVANIRDFVDDHASDVQLAIAYDACLSMLRVLRDKHIAIVTRYIVVPSREVRARSRSRSPEATRRRVNLATASSRQSTAAQERRVPPAGAGPQGIAFQPEKRDNLKGTGGTALISFLKQARDETGEPTVEEWARRFMSRQLRAEGKNDFFLGKPEGPIVPSVGVATEEVEVAGLAGTWTIDDDVGGICHY